MATQIDLREALKTAVQSNLTLPDGTVTESRYMPRVEAGDLDDLHLSFFVLDVQTETVGREVDVDEYTIAVAVQQKVPQARESDVVCDGGDNITFLDEKVAFVESVKDLFRAEGALRHTTLAGCYFVKMTHTMQFEPLHLVQYGIFTSIIELTFKSEEE